MNDRLATPLAELERARQATLALLAPLAQAQLDARPAPGKWSAGEVFDHLVLAEEIQRREIEHLIGLALAGRPTLVRRSVADLDVSVLFIPKPLLPLLSLPFSVANAFVPVSAIPDLHDLAPQEHSTVAWVCAAALGALLLSSFMRLGPRAWLGGMRRAGDIGASGPEEPRAPCAHAHR